MFPGDWDVLSAAVPNAASDVPLYRQLYRGLRQIILSGQLKPGTKLPSTRFLGNHLGISRNTVLNAFEQLIAEGYLESRPGSGTYVASTLPDDFQPTPLASAADTPHQGHRDRTLSQRGARLALPPRMPLMPLATGNLRAFTPGLIDAESFPCRLWGRLVVQCWQRSAPDLLNYCHGAGYQPLREAIATYLGTARGVRCTANQVIVIAGAQQGIDLVARVLLDSGDVVWMEDPGYPGAYGVFTGAGLTVAPVPFDDEGLQVSTGEARFPEARLAFVTPSHQFPLGVSMSLRRRLALLAWAGYRDAWILEDDYDSEYRYSGRPLAALQGIDHEGRVIYLGTFSKVMFPALRIGYLVVPPDLVDAFTNARFYAAQHPPLLEQTVLAEFIDQGHFGRHVRRTRTLYARRQVALVDAVLRELDGYLQVEPTETGMHLLGWLPEGVDDNVASAQAAALGVTAIPLSTYVFETARPSALLLGYTALSEPEIEAGVRHLARALDSIWEPLG